MRNLTGDLAGGFSAALIAIPYATTLGLLAFAPLGAEYAAAGVAAALVASVIANVVGALVPAARAQIMGPRASVTVVFAGILAGLVTHPLLHAPAGTTPAEIFAAAFLIVLLAGLFQVVFAFTGAGHLIKFVPYPVIAGFMNGIALTLIASQLAPALGLEAGRPPAALLAESSAIRPASLLVALAVLGTILLAPRVTRAVPPLVCGLAVGIPLHHAIAAMFPGAVGPVVGSVPAIGLNTGELQAMLAFAKQADGAFWGQVLLPGALLLAAVAALDGLLASVAADAVTRGHHDSRRVLVGQGIATVIGAALAAIPIAANAHTRIGNYLAGGRTRASTLFHAAFMLAALLGLGPLLSAVPVAALAGIIFYIAWTLIDRWTREMARRLGAGTGLKHEIALNLAIVLGVALTLMLVNVMVAFAVGLLAAIVLLLVKLSGSPVRRVLDGTMRASLKVRAPEARALLQSLATRIRILELEGELFFGTVDRLKADVEALPADARFAILDFRRVHEVDASGARTLGMISQAAAQRGLQVLLSHVRPDDALGESLRALGAEGLDEQYWFADLDRALEWAEDRLLESERFEDGPERAPAEMALLAGLDEAGRAAVLEALERHELGHGDPVFREGDPGDRLYLIARGAVSIKVKLDDEARARRLATFGSGVFFGEMALMEQGGRRSADAFAKGDRVVLYSLAAERFSALVRRHPEAALRLYQNLSRELAARLRVTSGALRALE